MDLLTQGSTDSTIRWTGTDLQRPECVLATAAGTLFASDRRGGVMRINADGAQQLIGRSKLAPNGIAMKPDGSFLIANLGPDGGVWELTPEGEARPWLMEVEGQRLPGVNFVALDEEQRVWISVSARDTGDRYPIGAPSGFIVLHDARGTRIVGEGLDYTNECRLSADRRFLYVNETFGKCLSRFEIESDGALRERVVVARFGEGDFPDGLALDEEGGAWVVCVGSNRVYRVTQDGASQVWIDDADPAVVKALEAAFRERRLTRTMLSKARGRHLHNITSLAFGGPNRRIGYLGCLAGDSLATFMAPVAGLPLAHWNGAG